MPQMSNLWWLCLIMYFSTLLLIMNTIIFTIFPLKNNLVYSKSKANKSKTWKW
nr:ATP synthase F0 subunit 8 [Scelimena sp. 1 JL-2023a]